MTSPHLPRIPLPSRRLALAGFGALALSACGGGTLGGGVRTDGLGNNPSPIAGSRSSVDANQRADMGQGQNITYANVAKQGPRIIVLPGEIKGAHATFTQRFTSNNIADYAENELINANFMVLERSQLGALFREVELAYNAGDQRQAQRAFQKGQLETTRWIMKFDILKAEPVASSGGGIDGRTAADLIGVLGGRGKVQDSARVITRDTRTNSETQVWNVQLRMRLIDANTTQVRLSRLYEDKMEVGRTSATIGGFNTRGTGGLGIDSMVQRLVQRGVVELDAQYK